MKVIDPGHRYLLAGKGGRGGEQELQFYKDTRLHEGDGCNGVLGQEVLRVQIDRIKYLQEHLPGPENEAILYHLRAALLEYEVRALRRKLEKGRFKPEDPMVGPDGHYQLHYEDGNS